MMASETKTVRLQKIIASSGISSRRKAEEYIRHGLVTVNGETVMTLGTKVDPLHDHIKVNGRHLKSKLPDMFVMLNKPVGYLSTLHDPDGRPTIKQLMPKPSLRLFPVGRLDFDSEGLLLLTNNGDIAQACLHPTHHVQKTYLVKVKGVLEDNQVQQLRRGVSLEDGQTAPAKVKKAGKAQANSWIEITIHEGRKHQVKRMFEHIGHPVLRLKRIQFGPLNLGKLLPGKTRYLTDDEANDLRHLSEISGASSKPAQQVMKQTIKSPRLPSSETPSRWASNTSKRTGPRPNPRLASSGAPSRLTSPTSKRPGPKPRVATTSVPTRPKSYTSKLPGPKPRLASTDGPSGSASHTSKRHGPKPRPASSRRPSPSSSNASKYPGKRQKPTFTKQQRPRSKPRKRT
jgi:23S rRNA pseudouridine2605 synthase